MAQSNWRFSHFQKTAFSSDCTSVCLGVDNAAEHDRLTSSPATSSPNIFFVNRANVPDLKVSKDTQKLFQTQPCANDATGKQEFIMCFLPCSCANYRNNTNDFENCEFNSTRNAQTRMIKQKKSNDEEPSNLSGMN